MLFAHGIQSGVIDKMKPIHNQVLHRKNPGPHIKLTRTPQLTCPVVQDIRRLRAGSIAFLWIFSSEKSCCRNVTFMRELGVEASNDATCEHQKHEILKILNPKSMTSSLFEKRHLSLMHILHALPYLARRASVMSPCNAEFRFQILMVNTTKPPLHHYILAKYVRDPIFDSGGTHGIQVMVLSAKSSVGHRGRICAIFDVAHREVHALDAI
mmetsp:Transcript_17185/g.42298  ORF Transcript_17185/g.42298 Transcript_17185/m.42298 type:complete len:211 (-) Transcript_17185:391-1023(-)